MKIVKSYFYFLLPLAAVSVFALADSGVPVTVAPVAATVEPSAFFAQVLQVIQSLGGLSMLLKVSALITLIVASMKVSFLNNLVWKKLGEAQVWVAPVLGLVAGLLHLLGGSAFSWAMVFAYLSAGGGAVFLHEILDSIKAIPGLGAVYIKLINLVESALGGQKPPQA